MERLTERDSNGVAYLTCMVEEINTEKLCQYEEMEEQGLMIKLPVPLGSEIWEIFYRKDDFSGQSYPTKARTNFSLNMLNKIGKTIFLTEEEAEEVIAKM